MACPIVFILLRAQQAQRVYRPGLLSTHQSVFKRFSHFLWNLSLVISMQFDKLLNIPSVKFGAYNLLTQWKIRPCEPCGGVEVQTNDLSE